MGKSGQGKYVLGLVLMVTKVAAGTFAFGREEGPGERAPFLTTSELGKSILAENL